MQCPVCANVSLQMTERRGIEIDYCPQCRGVWLDRGELDKLIERSASSPAGSGNPDVARDAPSRHVPYRDDDHDEDYRKRRGWRGWLGEIFD